MTSQDINNKLESLVHNRFTKEELNTKLSQLFGCKVEVAEYEREECVKQDLPELDNQLLFPIENKDINLYLDVDLFYLTDNGNKLYITETNFEFQ